jgi:predicted RNase H-like nuclease (RuvC/YqgF family)
LVRAVGDEVVYENKSKQGTFVNGRKVTFMCKLIPGDNLEIGPYAIAALAEPPAPTEDLVGTIQLDKSTLSLKAKLQEALQVMRKLEAEVKAKQAEAEAKAKEAEAKEAEVATTRRELESEVWRGLATHRDLAQARERVAELQRQLEDQQDG